MPYFAPEAPMPITSWAPRFADINAKPHTHAGMARPARKKSVLVFIELLRATPMPRTNAKYKARISQSIPVIRRSSFPSLTCRSDQGAFTDQKSVYEARSVHEVASLPQANAPTPNAGVFGFPEPQFFDLTNAVVPFYRSRLHDSPTQLSFAARSSLRFRIRTCHTN